MRTGKLVIHLLTQTPLENGPSSPESFDPGTSVHVSELALPSKGRNSGASLLHWETLNWLLANARNQKHTSRTLQILGPILSSTCAYFFLINFLPSFSLLILFLERGRQRGGGESSSGGEHHKPESRAVRAKLIFILKLSRNLLETNVLYKALMWLPLCLNRRSSWLVAGPGQIMVLWKVLSGQLWQGLKIDPGPQPGTLLPWSFDSITFAPQRLIFLFIHISKAPRILNILLVTSHLTLKLKHTQT